MPHGCEAWLCFRRHVSPNYGICLYGRGKRLWAPPLLKWADAFRALGQIPNSLTGFDGLRNNKPRGLAR
jgi:hypothetical protein